MVSTIKRDKITCLAHKLHKSHSFFTFAKKPCTLHLPLLSRYHNSMLGKKSLFGGFIGLFFVSIVVFFIIYFLVPEVSIKFFGTTFRADAYIEASLESAMVEAGISQEDASAIIQDDGPAVLKALMDKAGNNLGRLVSYLSSPEGKAMVGQGADYIRSGAGSLVEYIEGHEDFS